MKKQRPVALVKHVKNLGLRSNLDLTPVSFTHVCYVDGSMTSSSVPFILLLILLLDHPRSLLAWSSKTSSNVVQQLSASESSLRKPNINPPLPPLPQPPSHQQHPLSHHASPPQSPSSPPPTPTTSPTPQLRPQPRTADTPTPPPPATPPSSSTPSPP